MNITVFGTGYVGLVQGAVLAYLGHHVLCIDVDVSKITELKQGKVSIYEPGLSDLVTDAQEKGTLDFSIDARRGSLHGDVIFIAVGTPPDKDGAADLQYVMAVAETIAKHTKGYKVIVNKSTVPIGTADRVREKILEILTTGKIGMEFDVVSNPEFLKEGSAVHDCLNPDRIILGTCSQRAELILREVYARFESSKIIVMDERSAELTKYAANSILATKISFINEIASLAEYFNADIELVCRGIASDSRIGPHFISPGLGYGGSCFPKDVRALICLADGVGFDAKILKAVEARNFEQKNSLFGKISTYFYGHLEGKVIAIWGLAFKPNTDDIREAASCALIDALLNAGAIVYAYDPKANDNIRRMYCDHPDVMLVNSKDEVLQGADVLAIVTEWDEFRTPDFNFIKQCLKKPVIFDGRNMYDIELVQSAGLEYYSVGRVNRLEKNRS